MSAETITTEVQKAVGDGYRVVVRELNGSYFGEATDADGRIVEFALTPPDVPKEPKPRTLVSEDAQIADKAAGDRVEAALVRVGAGIYAATVESLDALPDDSVVQVVERMLWRVGEERFHETYSYFQKSGRGWLELDPSDRDDGENTESSGYLISKANHFGMKSDTRIPGSVRVLFVPEARR